MTTKRNTLLRLGEAVEHLYGQNTTATRQRLARLADTGELRCVRIGERQDRWFPSAELDRLLGADA